MAAGMLLVAACSNDDPEAAPSRTVQVLTTTTTTNPYAVPPVIDVVYVNRVLAGLDQVVGEAVRSAARARTLTPEAEAYLRATYSDEARAFALHRQFLKNEAEKSADLFRPEPGNQVTTVSELISAAADCIFAHVQRDFSAVVLEPNSELGDQWVGLKRLDPKRDPGGVNPTGWMYVYEGFAPDRRRPSDPCVDS